MALPKTYTLYIRDNGDHGRFEPAMCMTDVEAMARARALLVAHPDCETVEAFFGDKYLFSVWRASS